MKWPKHIFLLAVLFVCACADAEELDTYLRNKGLVDISAQDSSIRVQLVYATPDNFMGKQFIPESRVPGFIRMPPGNLSRLNGY